MRQALASSSSFGSMPPPRAYRVQERYDFCLFKHGVWEDSRTSLGGLALAWGGIAAGLRYNGTSSYLVGFLPFQWQTRSARRFGLCFSSVVSGPRYGQGTRVSRVLGTMERRVRLSHWLSRGNADSAFGSGVSCNEVYVILEIAMNSAFCSAIGTQIKCIIHEMHAVFATVLQNYYFCNTWQISFLRTASGSTNAKPCQALSYSSCPSNLS